MLALQLTKRKLVSRSAHSNVPDDTPKKTDTLKTNINAREIEWLFVDESSPEPQKTDYSNHKEDRCQHQKCVN